MKRIEGRVHAYRKVGQYAFARITESGTGKELWRCRGVGRFELDRKASVFTSLDHFVSTMRRVLGPEAVPPEVT